MKARRGNISNRPYLLGLLLDFIENRFKGGVRESGLVSRLHISLIPAREPLRSKVEGVAKGFMDALKIFPGHEHLGEVSWGGLGIVKVWNMPVRRPSSMRAGESPRR